MSRLVLMLAQAVVSDGLRFAGGTGWRQRRGVPVRGGRFAKSYTLIGYIDRLITDGNQAAEAIRAGKGRLGVVFRRLFNQLARSKPTLVACFLKNLPDFRNP